MTEAELPVHVLLSAQRALLGAVTANIREISIQWSGLERLRFRVVYDSHPSEDDIETMEIVTTEIAADIPFQLVDEVEAIVSTAPLNKLERLGRIIYQRKETDTTTS